MFLNCRRGDTTTWTFRVFEDGLPRDVSGDFIRFTLKYDYDDADIAAIIRKSTTTSGVSIILPQTGDDKGTFNVTLIHTDTKTLPKNLSAVWDVQMTLSDGSVVTPFTGEFGFVNDVTFNSGSIASDT